MKAQADWGHLPMCFRTYQLSDEHAATALRAVPAWFWYTVFFYRYSSTITAPFTSPFVATIYKPSLLYLGFLTLPLFPPFFSLSLFSSFTTPPSFHPSSHSYIYAYNMPIQLLCRPVLHYIQLYGLRYPWRRHALYSCHARRNNNSVELLRYRHRRPTYLLADWSCYATPFFLSSNHRPSGDTTPSNTPFQIYTVRQKKGTNFLLCASFLTLNTNGCI